MDIIHQDRLFVSGMNMNPQLPADSSLYRIEDVGYILSKKSEPWKYRIVTSKKFTADWEIGTSHEVFREGNGKFMGLYEVIGFVRFYTMETRGYVPTKKLAHWIDRGEKL
jgi:hypothetical protein